MWSSNHCAWPAIFAHAFVFSTFTWKTMASQAPFMPRASR